MLKRHIQLHNCMTKLGPIFLIRKFSLEFEEDTKEQLKQEYCEFRCLYAIKSVSVKCCDLL